MTLLRAYKVHRSKNQISDKTEFLITFVGQFAKLYQLKNVRPGPAVEEPVDPAGVCIADIC
jgi:hypothetical protein